MYAYQSDLDYSIVSENRQPRRKRAVILRNSSISTIKLVFDTAPIVHVLGGATTCVRSNQGRERIMVTPMSRPKSSDSQGSLYSCVAILCTAIETYLHLVYRWVPGTCYCVIPGISVIASPQQQ